MQVYPIMHVHTSGEEPACSDPFENHILEPVHGNISYSIRTSRASIVFVYPIEASKTQTLDVQTSCIRLPNASNLAGCQDTA